MPTTLRERLDAECNVLSRYLTGLPADEYVRAKFAEAHERTPHFAAAGRFDALLLRLGTCCVAGARFADSYAAILARRSTLRRKLVLLAAILESSGAERGHREAPDSESRAVLLAQLAGRGIVFLFCLLVAAVPLLLLRLLLDDGHPHAAPQGGGH
jgi:hypothetical protein